MHISKISAYSFCGNSFVIAYDDSISQERRKFIRENIIYETMRYQEIYEKEPRLDEYQLKNSELSPLTHLTSPSVKSKCNV